MDGSQLILTDPVSSPAVLPNVNNARLKELLAKSGELGSGEVSDSKKVQLAKDFESVLLTQLFDEMKNTIGDWGFEQDGASKQVQGMFWLYLARDVADKGGFGLWKDIYRFFNDLDLDKTNAQTRLLDESV